MNANPMRKARAALNQHPKCGAHCRTTGQPCRSPAMANGRCRMDGGPSSGAPRSEKHWNYKHGRRSAEGRIKAWRERQEAKPALHRLRQMIAIISGEK